MKRGARNWILLALLGAVIGLDLALAPNRARPNLEFMPDMAHQPRWSAFAGNPYFPDGKTLREPVAGTIPRGAPPLHYAPSPQGAERAGAELVNPIPPAERKAALTRGKVLFKRLCVPCHGEKGGGDGPVALRGFPPPAALTAPKARELPDGGIFHILTYGRGNMPAYATQMTREDRWRVILFLRKLQEEPPAGGER